jgi:3',5'-cyclic AMP phosphodiesterase CpdA
MNPREANDGPKAIFKFVDILASHKIPFAAIYGNHDDEGSLNRAGATELLQTLPYSMTQAGPNTVPGVGNYYIRVLSHTGHHAALTMFFLDTHSYSPDDKKYKGYDWIKPEQITWFRETAESLKADNRKYSHVHLDMAFIHIPLPEYREGGVLIGERREPPTAPGYNSGFRDALLEMGVPVVSCGHDHANDYCLLSEKLPDLPDKKRSEDFSAADPNDPPIHPDVSAPEPEIPPSKQQNHKSQPKNDKIWLCYGGGAGFGGYGGWGGYVRRVRFFELDANEAKIRTWKRLEYGDLQRRIDEQVIVDAGRVVSS